MPKPRRRRRFFALEGRFEVDDTGELQGIADRARSEPASTRDPEAASDGVGSQGSGRSETPDAPNPVADGGVPPAFRTGRSPRTRTTQRRLFSGPSLLLALACLGGGALAGYLSARTGNKPAVADPSDGVQKGVGTLTKEDENDLDAAYGARHAHHHDEALKFFTALQRRHPNWGPVEVEFGRTLFYAKRSYDAVAVLRAASEKGWKPAEANFLLGVLYKARKSYREAESNFARSVAFDPTEPEPYFFWGECLREQGKLLDAAAKFRSALLRNQYETATSLYRAKLWLCAIEADQNDSNGVNSQVDAALKEAQPPLEAFVAAAARELKAGDPGAAAAHLSRARRRSDAAVFRYIISDPLFVPARSMPEFANLFQSAPPATSPEMDAAENSPAPAATGSEPVPAPSAPPSDSPAKTEKP